MYNVGDKIFIPYYGGGTVEGIIIKKLFNVEYKYINITFILNGMRLYIPVERISEYNIRKISSVGESNSVLRKINIKPSVIEKKWSKRYKQNNDRINDGSMYKNMEVVRELKYLESTTGIPPGEKKIFERAEGMLAGEIALIFSMELKSAYDIIAILTDKFKEQ